MKSKTGLMVARAAALRTNINIDGRPLPTKKLYRNGGELEAKHAPLISSMPVPHLTLLSMQPSFSTAFFHYSLLSVQPSFTTLSLQPFFHYSLSFTTAFNQSAPELAGASELVGASELERPASYAPSSYALSYFARGGC